MSESLNDLFVRCYSAAAVHPTEPEGLRLDLDDWYRRFGEAVHRRARRLSGDDTLAWDVTQEVFLRAHLYAHSFREGEKPLSWLFTITDRCFFDMWRARKKETLRKEEVEAFLADEEVPAMESAFSRHQLVANLVGRATKDVQQIVILRYFDEMSHEEIALALDVNERTVRRKLDRFLAGARKLARRLQ